MPLAFAAVLLGTISSCDQGKTSTPASVAVEKHAAGAEALPHGPSGDIVATVNGKSLRAIDIRFSLKKPGSGSDESRLRDREVVDAVITSELLRQRAEALGMDTDQDYKERLFMFEARMEAFKREALAKLILKAELEALPAVTDAQVRAFFDENDAEIRTDVHVMQIQHKGDEASAEKILADIKGGAPFEQAAARAFRKLSEGQTPWDLGYVTWNELPAHWRGALYGMQKGEVSPLLEDPMGRRWILKRVDTRANPNVTFDTAKAAIAKHLAGAQVATRLQAFKTELRDSAKITYAAAPESADKAPAQLPR